MSDEMADDSIDHASLIPASELLFHAVLSISDITKAANEILIQKDNFRKFSTYLEKVSLILKGLSKEEVPQAESLKNSLGVLNQQVKVAKQLVYECNCKSKIYLLISCRKIAKNLECCTKNISRAVSLIPLTSSDVSSSLSKQISELCQNMLDDEYKASAAEEEILKKLEWAIQEGNAERPYANQLLARVVDVIGISNEHAVIKREFKELKSNMQIAGSRRDIAEALHMEQIVGVLEKADSVTSSQEKEKKYFEKRNSLGRQLMEPLHSFYCPISLDIMEDPVETSSGETFERKAIEKWLAEGNNKCPLTTLPLDTSKLRPNKTLRQSIQEWKDRNTIITLSTLKSKLESDDDEEEMLQSLEKLQGLCLERQMHREWLKMENYITTLIKLLGAKNREIRKRVLSILSLLAKDNEENKEDIAKADNALESIVRCLARQIEESKLAVELLLELSRSTAVRDLIGDVQGSILLLVTMLSSDDVEAAHNARELLGNLSFLNQKVIEMAKANYLKPLLQNLSSGTENVKIIMAKTLSEIELTDQNKVSIVKDGALQPLLQLLSNSDVQIKEVAVKALLQLSSLPVNGLLMIREGVAQSLFELLFRHSLQSTALREQAAATMVHLAMSTTHQRADEVQVSLLDSEDDVFKFFSLVSFTGPDIQSKILKTFLAMCQSPSGLTIRESLRQLSAVQVLVRLLELDNQTVRANAMKLFYYLTEGGDDCRNFTSHITERCINVLITIIKTTDDAEEVVSAMGIISRLPREPHITKWLLDSGAVKIILDCLLDRHKHPSHKRQVIEKSVQALCRFTVSTNIECQKTVAQEGIIPILVQLLDSGTSLSKQNAAISIKQFSESSRLLSKPIKNPGIFKFCFVPHEIGCPAHLGTCTIESSFCIIEADALKPLVRLLEEQDIGTCETSVDALLTLIQGETPHGGCKVLADANAITPLIKLLSLQSARLQEKILVALAKIFQVEEIKNKYKGSATMPLVDITQRKDSRLRSLAARVLAQLGVLEEQSSYF